MKSKNLMNWQDETALERFQIIQPLLDPDDDPAKIIALRKKIAIETQNSERTLRRWERAYFEHGFSGLKPKDRQGYMSSRLPENFPYLLAEAIQLKKEVPTRSVQMIIDILEGEEKVEEGVLKRSTLQRYLFNAGLGQKHLKMYMQDEQATMTRRFCKPHRMMLAQADIKYGVAVIRKEDGSTQTAYLSSIIDDHSRFVLWAEWYLSQDEYCVEDVFRKAILRQGKFDKAYTDNGSQYISKQLKKSCAMLGIRLIRAPVRSGKSKGKVEKYHQTVDKFLAEAKVKKIGSLAELNRYWQIYLEQYYHKKPHEGIREYYRSRNIEIPKKGISPEQEFYRDSRPLVFLDAGTVAAAFLFREERIVDQGGLISFQGRKYEAGAAWIGHKVVIAFDPHNDTVITVCPKDAEPFKAVPVAMGEYVAPVKEMPAGLTTEEADTSRLLDMLEKKHNESQKKMADAISYGDYREEQ